MIQVIKEDQVMSERLVREIAWGGGLSGQNSHAHKLPTFKGRKDRHDPCDTPACSGGSPRPRAGTCKDETPSDYDQQAEM